MKLTSTHSILITAVLSTAALAHGQSQSDQVQRGKTNVPLQGQNQIFFRADKLVGREAQSPLGQDLGKIQDIAFSPEHGVYGVVKAENDRLVALPWSLVTAVTEKVVVFNTSQQAIAGAPSFTDKQWTRLNDPQFTAKLQSHFKVTTDNSRSYPETASGTSSSSPQGSSQAQGGSTNGSQTSGSGTGSGSSTNAPSPGQPQTDNTSTNSQTPR